MEVERIFRCDHCGAQGIYCMDKDEHLLSLQELSRQGKEQERRVMKKLNERQIAGISLEIGVFVSERRQEKGLTQIDLSKLSGISQANISKIESGKNFKIDILIKLSRALGTGGSHTLLGYLDFLVSSQ